ncbi:radical SAM protein [Micromonospora sp. M12]
MRGLAAVPSYVVMQPTTLCNLDCAYCYLPFRAADRRMSVPVAEAVAAAVSPWAATGRFSVVWHGGEPLAAGREHLADLIAPFGPEVEHHVQTNATLIDDDWCDFFVRHEMRVSVSVDGPRRATATGSTGRSAGVRPDSARHFGAAPPWSALLRAGRGVPAGAGARHRAVRLLPRAGLRRVGHQHRGDRGSTPATTVMTRPR